MTTRALRPAAPMSRLRVFREADFLEDDSMRRTQDVPGRSGDHDGVGSDGADLHGVAEPAHGVAGVLADEARALVDDD